jgi:hypothetical protein
VDHPVLDEEHVGAGALGDRQTVIELAKRRGYEVVERRIRLEELAGFTECFITG